MHKLYCPDSKTQLPRMAMTSVVRITFVVKSVGCAVCTVLPQTMLLPLLICSTIFMFFKAAPCGLCATAFTASAFHSLTLAGSSRFTINPEMVTCCWHQAKEER